VREKTKRSDQLTRMKNEQYLENMSFPFFTDIYFMPAGEVVAEHSHEFFELAYIAEESGKHKYNKGEYHPFKPGDVFIIEPLIEHAYQICIQEMH
jgi:quercetin dioxygenase-like cupin family protein